MDKILDMSENNRLINATSTSTCAKRRGRPRKTLPFEKNKLNLNSVTKEVEEEIVLHLPITKLDIQKYLNDVSDTDYVENTENIDTNIFSKNKDNKHQDTDVTDVEANIFTITDITCGNSSSDDSNYFNEKMDGLVNRLKEQELLINSLKSQLDDSHKKLKLRDDSGVIEKRITKMNINFISVVDGKQILAEKTDIACWWCTYNFNTVPCFLPEKFVDDTYCVFGCFCSYNCAAAYNVFELDDYSVSNRYSLLKRLYNTVYKCNDEISFLVEKRNIFQKFGGTLSYEKYRENCITNSKDYRFVMPPMKAIIPFIEEESKDFHVIKHKVNTASSDDELVLKRTKVLPNARNNVIESMGLLNFKKK